MSSNEAKLRAALQRLETSVEKVLSTRGYNKDAKGLKALHEMIKEQLIDANTRSATRAIR
jgi:hypothetical protein